MHGPWSSFKNHWKTKNKLILIWCAVFKCASVITCGFWMRIIWWRKNTLLNTLYFWGNNLKSWYKKLCVCGFADACVSVCVKAKDQLYLAWAWQNSPEREKAHLLSIWDDFEQRDQTLERYTCLHTLQEPLFSTQISYGAHTYTHQQSLRIRYLPLAWGDTSPIILSQAHTAVVWKSPKSLSCERHIYLPQSTYKTMFRTEWCKFQKNACLKYFY